MAHEHARDLLERRAQREPDSDLARPLRYRVRDDSINADHTEKQRHAAGDGQQHQSEGGARQRPIVNRLQRSDVGQGQIRIDTPDGLPYLLKQTGGSCSRRAEHDRHAAAYGGPVALEILLHQRPIDDSGSFLIHAVVAFVGHHADDFAPIVLQGRTDMLTQRQTRVVPQLARQILRYQRHRHLVIRVGPRQVAARD